MATIRRRSVFDRYAVTEKYLYARAKALTLRPNSLGIKLSHDTQVYGAVIDMPMGPSTLGTLVCLANGTANLYLNNGNSVAGEASKYRSVANAARSAVASFRQILPSCERVIEYDLPVSNTYYVYLLTKKGIYKMSYDPSKLNVMIADETVRTGRFAHFLIQQVMKELSAAQMKDKAAVAKHEKQE